MGGVIMNKGDHIQNSLCSSQNYTSLISTSSLCISWRYCSSCSRSLAAAQAFALRSSMMLRLAYSSFRFWDLAEWTYLSQSLNSFCSAVRSWCVLAAAKRSLRVYWYFFLFQSVYLVLGSFLMKRMQIISMNSYQISSQFNTFRIFRGIFDELNSSVFSRFRTSLSKYFYRIFSRRPHSASPKQPLIKPYPKSSLTRMVSSLREAECFEGESRALKTSVLALRQKGVRFFSALLMDDLFQLIFSLPAALRVLLMLSKKGVILAINFSVDFWGLSKEGSM